MNRRLLLSAVTTLAGLIAGARNAAATVQAAAAHRLALHVDSNDAAIMELALLNAAGATRYFAEHGAELEVELVAYGPGLHMLRADTSPVKPKLAEVHAALPQIVFSACNNTLQAMQRAEGHEISILPLARIVPAGVVRLIELQEQGFRYVKP